MIYDIYPKIDMSISEDVGMGKIRARIAVSSRGQPEPSLSRLPLVSLNMANPWSF
jgi:hypothetical protein